MSLRKLIYSFLLLLLFSCNEEEIEESLADGLLYSKEYELTYSEPLKLDTFSAELTGDDLNSSMLHFKIVRFDGILLYEEYVDGETIIGDDEDLDSLDNVTRAKVIHSRVDNFLHDKAEVIILLEKLRSSVKKELF